jgi:hypothetical protein
MGPRFNSRILQSYFEGLITSGAKIYCDRLPATGRIVYITITPGPGAIRELTADVVGFNVQVKGAENNYEDAEDMALDVDSIVLEFGVPVEIDGVVIHALGRTGGAPQQVSIPDTANRYTFSCNYFAEVSTNIGSYV